MRSSLLTLVILTLCPVVVFAGYSKEQRHYWDAVMPIMRTYCNNSCHNADDNKGGLNLNRYDFIMTIQKEGEVFAKVIEYLEDGSMPPEGKPQLSQTEKDTFLFYIKKYLDEALSTPDPGIIISRRLNNWEYQYAIQDMTGIRIDADSLFPRDPAGGEGFDNYAQILYLTPLLMERYFEVGEYVVEELYCNPEQWRMHVPANQFSWKQRFRHWWNKWRRHTDLSFEAAYANAKNAVIPFGTLAYRRYLTPPETEDLLHFFREVYQSLPESRDRYDLAVKEVFKAILVSPHFLIRQETDPPVDTPYPVSGFELATRLSFFLWSSIPDRELLEAAYRKDLHDPSTLKAQVQRMLKDPKARRMAERFAAQWLETEKLRDPATEVDAGLFPEFTGELREAMYQEATHYFYHTMTQSKNFLELLSGQYTFLNETLAVHYGVEGVEGSQMRRVELTKNARGGILGMAGVLTATSLPNRTSPVLRGKWIMEKILATEAKPPPPNVPELEAAKGAHDEMTLREMLVIHREDPACMGCHQEMDDLGFALENFDAIGRWRKTYPSTEVQIDVTGSLKSGEQFDGVAELKEILLEKKDRFAKGLSKKMLGFALGRSIDFKDQRTVNHLANTLMENKFDPGPFFEELAMSYPFRYKKSDPVVIDTEFGD